MKVPIGEIRIRDGRRGLDPVHAGELADSIRELGLLNPVTIDKEKNLIAGLHRLEAARLLGWGEVECVVSSLEGLQAELAEIDENFVRSDLPAVEYGEMLLRRKEIYETLHPETKATYDGGPFRGNQHKSVVGDKMSVTTRSFVQDTADKLGVVPRTVERQIQTAKNLTAEAKAIIRDADIKLSKKAVKELSRLGPERQKEAASLLAAGEIRTVDEYMGKTGERRQAEPAQGGMGKRSLEPEPGDRGRAARNAPGAAGSGPVPATLDISQGCAPQESSPQGYCMTGPPLHVGAVQGDASRKCGADEVFQGYGTADTPQGHGTADTSQRHKANVTPQGHGTGEAPKEDARQGGHGPSFRDLVAELKDPDKDCSGTPESFLEEYAAFVRKFHREIGWYNDPYYDTVYPFLDDGQLASLREMTQAICSAAEGMLHKVERMMKK